MKTKIATIISILALSLGMYSCSDTWEPNGGDKTGSLTLSDMEVEIDNAEKVISRAGIDKNDFIVRIYDQKNTLVGNWTYGTMPEIVTLNVGNYRVDVLSHEVKKAEWGKPYFAGSKEFSIADSKITEVGKVVCKFSSLKVTIKYHESLKKYLGDDVTVTVKANDEGMLVYTPTETRAGYFEVVKGSTTLTLTFAGTINGNYEEMVNAYTDVEPGQHRIVTYSLHEHGGDIPDESGSIDPSDGIKIDVSYEDENLNGNVNVDDDNLDGDDRPGKEEGGDDPTPPGPSGDVIKFESDLSFDSPNGIDKAEVAVVLIKSEKGIKNLKVDISTDNEGFQGAVSDLLPLSFDLANPGDDAEKFQSLGLKTGADVVNAKELEFDIRQFIPLLEAFPGTHNFKLTVIDQDNNQLSETLTFKS